MALLRFIVPRSHTADNRVVVAHYWKRGTSCVALEIESYSHRCLADSVIRGTVMVYNSGGGNSSTSVVV